MPQSCVLICPQDVTIDVFRDVLVLSWGEQLLDLRQESLEIQIRDPAMLSWYVNISQDEDTEMGIKEYGTEDYHPPNLVAQARKSNFFSISYNDYDRARLIIEQILVGLGSRTASTWLDNDNGRILQAADVLKSLKENKNWDWRAT